jgi:DNA-directed RNA polymerase subunit RPC12/RpoP
MGTDKVKLIKVICSKCGGTFDWYWGKQHGKCEHCDSELHIKEVHLAAGEIIKLFR